LNEARIKQMTGKADISARELFAKQSDVRPQFSLAIHTEWLR
jgi:hypothetical protein